MNRMEFIEKLRQALSGELTYHVVDENMEYYENYIDMELKSGKTEQSILQQLGDPRLIAKTIIETNKAEADAEKEMEYDEEKIRQENQRSIKSIRMPSWLIIILVMVIGMAVLGVVASLFVAALPYVLMIMAVSFVIRFVSKRL